MLKHLIFDEVVVDTIKEVDINKEILYNYLINGKLTLIEYLAICGNK